MSTSATENSASLGLVSQPGPWIPTAPSASLIRPVSGFISTVNVSPTPIVETSTGKNTTERSQPRATSCEVSSTASSIPSTTLAPDVITAYTSVCQRPETSAGSWKNVT